MLMVVVECCGTGELERNLSIVAVSLPKRCVVGKSHHPVKVIIVSDVLFAWWVDWEG